MKIPFAKMHGAGNDFVVFDATSSPFGLTGEQLKAVADRHFGVGCDQILVVEKASGPAADFRCIGISNHFFPDARGYRRPEKRSITRSVAKFPRSR